MNEFKYTIFTQNLGVAEPKHHVKVYSEDDPLRICFLGVDGVLNTKWSMFAHHCRTMFGVEKAKFCDQTAIAVLGTLCESLNMQIVLSSTWRLEILSGRSTTADFQRHFRLPIVDVTPRGSSKGHLRGFEIEDWMETNIPNHREKIASGEFQFCIIDDDSDMLDWQMDHFIRTHSDRGFTIDSAYCLATIFKQDIWDLIPRGLQQ